jgi:hypothetical protein
VGKTRKQTRSASRRAAIREGTLAMMTFYLEAEDSVNIADALRDIAILIEAGDTSGDNPTWNLEET